MKIVLAPDSFKGSMTAAQVCRALEAGVHRVLPDAQIISLPVADGGEGTLETLMTVTNGTSKSVVVRGPLGVPVKAQWGILPDGRGVIEMAQASGLGLVTTQLGAASRASSYGTGQLIKTALDAGCREILLAIGGSATTDGGIGALTALGLRAFDERNRVLEPGGAALANLARIETKFFDPRLDKTRFTILCDVTNPLHGQTGAAHVYGPQKGASATDVVRLDEALEHYADVVTAITGKDRRNMAGAGAAGGLGFGILSFCEADLQAGIEVVLRATRFDEVAEGASLILTGEGALDSQTLEGKAVAGVCRAAKRNGIQVVAFGGTVSLNGAEMDQLGVSSCFSLTDGPRDLEYCVAKGASLLADSVERALRLWAKS